MKNCLKVHWNMAFYKPLSKWLCILMVTKNNNSLQVTMKKMHCSIIGCHGECQNSCFSSCNSKTCIWRRGSIYLYIFFNIFLSRDCSKWFFSLFIFTLNFFVLLWIFYVNLHHWCYNILRSWDTKQSTFKTF